jgi:hypothetical protein
VLRPSIGTPRLRLFDAPPEKANPEPFNGGVGC